MKQIKIFHALCGETGYLTDTVNEFIAKMEAEKAKDVTVSWIPVSSGIAIIVTYYQKSDW